MYCRTHIYWKKVCIKGDPLHSSPLLKSQLYYLNNQNKIIKLLQVGRKCTSNFKKRIIQKHSLIILKAKAESPCVVLETPYLKSEPCSLSYFGVDLLSYDIFLLLKEAQRNLDVVDSHYFCLFGEGGCYIFGYPTSMLFLLFLMEHRLSSGKTVSTLHTQSMCFGWNWLQPCLQECGNDPDMSNQIRKWGEILPMKIRSWILSGQWKTLFMGL